GSTPPSPAPWLRSQRPMRSSRSARSSTDIPTRSSGSDSNRPSARRCRWSCGRRSPELPALFSPVPPQRDREKGDAVPRQVQPVGGHALAGRRSDGVPTELTEPIKRKVRRDVLDDLRQELLG